MVTEQETSLDELEKQFRANQIKMDLRVQEAQMTQLDRALSLDTSKRNLGSAGGQDVQEGLYNPQDYVDIMDYRRDNYGYQAYAATFTTKTDRQDGRNWPYWVSEPELAAIRGTVRLLTAYNKICFGVVNKLRNYTISKGLTRKVVSKKDAPKDLVEAITTVLDKFDTTNQISGGDTSMECEACVRDIRDGEVGLSLWHRGEGYVDLRTVEPDQVSEPTNKASLEDWLRPENDQDSGLPFVSNWSFGVHTTKGDTLDQHGYYVQWDGDWQNWDYLPGGNHPCYPPSGKNTWMVFRKRNTDRVIKRGVSDFWPISGDVELARKMIRNLAHAGALQAAIAWIREMTPGTTPAQVQSATMSTADWQTSIETANGGSRQVSQQTYLPGSTVYLGANQKFVPPPWTNSGMSAGLVQIFNTMLMSISQIWSMPEHMITGSASATNYASILEAGSPFVREVEMRQASQITMWLAVYWKVVWFNWKAGVFGGQMRWSDIKKAIDIKLTGPQIDVRDRMKETQKNLLLFNAGLMSPIEVDSREGLDYAEQVEQGAKKQAPPGPGGAGGGKLPSSGMPGMGQGGGGQPEEQEQPGQEYPQGREEYGEAQQSEDSMESNPEGINQYTEGGSKKDLGKGISVEDHPTSNKHWLIKVQRGGKIYASTWAKEETHPSADEVIQAFKENRRDWRPFNTSTDSYIARESENSINQGWIGVDLDGTLAEASEPCDVNTIGAPVPAMVEKVKEALLQGKDVKIFTARMSGDPKFVWAQHQLIRQWCLKNLGQVLDVTNQKDKDMVELWDDRAKAVRKNEGTFESENPLAEACGTHWRNYP